jgi:hypothetical protein
VFTILSRIIPTIQKETYGTPTQIRIAILPEIIQTITGTAEEMQEVFLEMSFQDLHRTTTQATRALQVIRGRVLLQIRQAALHLAAAVEAVPMRRQEGFNNFSSEISRIMGVFTLNLLPCVLAVNVHQQNQTV